MLAIGLVATPALAESDAPITVGFAMSVTGPLAPNGKQALAGAKIWEEETNAKGGLLGRLSSSPTTINQTRPMFPESYTKLLDVDKVDLVVSGYATNMVAPAMPVVMQKGKTFIGLFALDVNSEFHYPKYFSMLPTGPDTKASFTDDFKWRCGKSEAHDRRARVRRRCGVCAQRLRRRARECQAVRYRYRLRQVVSPPGTTDFSDHPRACRRRTPIWSSCALIR